MSIYGIDMGHSLSGAGSGASDIISETVENRKIGKELIRMLEIAGHTVVDCSVDYANSTNEQLNAIVDKANAQHLDFFLSIHFNAGKGSGTETYVVSTAGNAYKYAEKINEEVYKSCNFINRGIKVANFKVLRSTIAPAALLEVCFVDTPGDCEKLNTYSVAKAIFKALTGEDFLEPAAPSKPEDIYYRVIAGSYSNRINAEAQVQNLKIDGYDSFLDVFVKDETPFFRVVVGSYKNKENANRVLNELKAKVYPAFIDIYKK